MKTLKLIIGVFLFICLFGLLFLGWGTYSFFKSIGIQKQEYVLHIPDGTKQGEVADLLKNKGLIQSSIFFNLFVHTFYGTKAPIKGEYRIYTPVSGIYLARLFFTGPTQKEKEIVLPECWDVKKIADYLKKQGFQSDENIEKNELRNWGEQFLFFKNAPRGTGLEGFYFPDTYRVYEGTHTEDITKKALSNFHKKVLPLFPQNTSFNSLYQILTMASIVESEVRGDRDRALVADLLYRRIDRGMPLQVDASLKYIQEHEMSVDSEYNTYKVKGLPPGPLCNPGLSSIQAVLHPEKNEYWYFLTPPDGSVVYSKTFEEHVINKRKYLNR